MANYHHYSEGVCVYKGKRILKGCSGKRCSSRCKDYVESDFTGKPLDLGDAWFWKKSTNSYLKLLDALFHFDQFDLTSGKEGSKFEKSRYEKGHYPYIARGTGYIANMLIPIYEFLYSQFDDGRRQRKVLVKIKMKDWPPKLLDCGCGVGNVVALASVFGFRAYGIEYDSETLRRGREMMKKFRLPKSSLFQGDLLEFDGFGDYDVLYGYCPLSKGDLERQFEERMLQQMKPGAIVVGVSHPNRIHTFSNGDVGAFCHLRLNYAHGGYSGAYLKVAHVTKEEKNAKTRSSRKNT